MPLSWALKRNCENRNLVDLSLLLKLLLNAFSSVADPLVHYGRHFGRRVQALCNIHALLTNGVLCMVELADRTDESFTAEERREHKVYLTLLQSVPGLEERLLTGTDEELLIIAELLRKGMSGARGDDTKSLKGAILDWITPKGQALQPPLSWNIKHDHGFNHKRTGSLLCLVFGSPVSRPEKDRNKTGPRLQKTGPAFTVFYF
ncbi:uncharacterized protein LACBIDRAFT_308823 [Laccaria bicolor S238N-H82]|uniref:Predicted protein n=1 Tax=Laccaria bicolor (strain S238N-H82 / ATCC MYA-4686) TaxID=486041 RepID=B0CX99_LACBS|nr:uncharacterized protein LACBIDRAFT_308823 [Laccaria bicolor S238N-H82]EDR13217.1 predicted protein [Laccaria bicolor S238N-H82]|eukprot:XP_001875715.1 predicted protein [Laccaria bicolor S238N-H82]